MTYQACKIVLPMSSNTIRILAVDNKCLSSLRIWCRHPQIVVSGQYPFWLLLKLVIRLKDSLTNGNQQDLTENVRSSSLLQHKILKQSKKSKAFLSHMCPRCCLCGYQENAGVPRSGCADPNKSQLNHCKLIQSQENTCFKVRICNFSLTNRLLWLKPSQNTL